MSQSLTIRKSWFIRLLIFPAILSLAFTDIFHFEYQSVSVSIYIIISVLILGLISTIDKIQNILTNKVVVLLFFIIINFILNLSDAKFTSVAYSIILLYSYFFYTRIIKKFFDKEVFSTFLKIVLYSYFLVLVASQILVLTNNATVVQIDPNFSLMHGPLGIVYEPFKNLYRYGALSSEPSYAATIVAITYWCFYTLNKSDVNKLVVPTIMSVYMIVGFKTVYGILLIILLVLFSARLNTKTILLLTLFSLTVIVMVFTFRIGGESMDRITNLLYVVLYENETLLDTINLLDRSAYARIAPLFLYLSEVSIWDYQLYFGHGAATSSAFFSIKMYPNHYETITFNPPFIPGFLYDYGILGVMLVVHNLLMPIIKRFFSFEAFLVILIFANANFNTQLFWYVILCISALNHFQKSN